MQTVSCWVEPDFRLHFLYLRMLRKTDASANAITYADTNTVTDACANAVADTTDTCTDVRAYVVTYFRTDTGIDF